MTEQQFLVQIGKGQCGTIFALNDTKMVLKVPKATHKKDELYQDYKVHRRVWDTFSDLPNALQASHNINVPEAQLWIDPNNTNFWTRYGHMIPRKEIIEVPNYGLVSDRIWPVPLPFRSDIVSQLCPKEIKKNHNAFLERPENKDCLVRLYLGRKRKDSPMTPGNVRMRNFPLHIDEMESLNLDAPMYAKTMAQALAILHWEVGVDANDVEFVLGSSPTISLQPTADQLNHVDKGAACSLHVHDFPHQTVAMWLLDFNQCNEFTRDAAGLKKLVDGFWWNDPYYPRPGDKLWEAFRDHYLTISGEFEETSMPKDFVDEVVRVGKQRAGGGLFGLSGTMTRYGMLRHIWISCILYVLIKSCL